MMKGKIIMKHNIKKITLLSALGATMLVATTPAQAAFQLKVDGQATIVPASQALNVAYPDGGAPPFVNPGTGAGGGFTVGMLYGPAASARGLVAGLNVAFNYTKAEYAKDANFTAGTPLAALAPDATLTVTGTNYLVPVTAMLGYQFVAGRFTIMPTAEIGFAYTKYDQTLESNQPSTQSTVSIAKARSYDGFIALAAGAGLSLGYAFTDKFALNVNGKWGYVGGKKDVTLNYTNVDGSTGTSPDKNIGSASYVTIGLGGTFAF